MPRDLIRGYLGVPLKAIGALPYAIQALIRERVQEKAIDGSAVGSAGGCGVGA